MTAELEHLLARFGDFERLRQQPWYSDVDAEMKRIAPGLQTFSWASNVLRESNGLVTAEGDNGSSHGIFQINVDHGLGQNLRLKHGRPYAIAYARDPIKAAGLMAREAASLGVNRIDDPKRQSYEFTRQVERPTEEVVKHVYHVLFGTGHTG